MAIGKVVIAGLHGFCCATMGYLCHHGLPATVSPWATCATVAIDKVVIAGLHFFCATMTSLCHHGLFSFVSPRATSTCATMAIG